MDAVELVMETGLALAGFIACFLNLVLPEEIADEETSSYDGQSVENARDREEWDKIKHSGSDVEASSPATTRAGGVAVGGKVE